MMRLSTKYAAADIETAKRPRPHQKYSVGVNGNQFSSYPLLGYDTAYVAPGQYAGWGGGGFSLLHVCAEDLRDPTEAENTQICFCVRAKKSANAKTDLEVWISASVCSRKPFAITPITPKIRHAPPRTILEWLA